MSQKKLAFEGGYVVSPEGFIEGGLVLTSKSGKIDYVGPLKKYKRENYDLIDCGGNVVSPGLIDAHTHLGVYAEGSGPSGEDGNEMSDPVTPHVRAIDAIDHTDHAFLEAREAGVTSVMVTPGSANVFGGQVCAVKTSENFTDDMVIDPYVGQKIAFGENPKRVYGSANKAPMTRMGIAALIRATLVKAQNYKKQLKKKGGTDRDLKMEALQPVINGKIPVRAHAHRADDILTAIRIAEEFSLKLVIEHGTEAYKVADVLAAKKIPVNIGPTSIGRVKSELKDLERDNAVKLMKAGCHVSIITDHPVLPIQDVRQEAVKLVRDHGAPMDIALWAITANPAVTLGLEKKIGGLAKGMDADIVVFNGYPTDPSAICLTTAIDGKIVYNRKR